MSKGTDPALLLLETISSSLRNIENIGDVVYADPGIGIDTKKQVDALIVKINKIFTEAIRKIEDAE